MRCNLFGVEGSARAASAACRALILLAIALVVGINQKIYRSGADIAPEEIFLSEALERVDFSGHCWNCAAVTTDCLREMTGSYLLGAEIALRQLFAAGLRSEQTPAKEMAGTTVQSLYVASGRQPDQGSSYPICRARKLRQGCLFASGLGHVFVCRPARENLVFLDRQRSMRSMRSMRCVLFSAIKGPLLQRWYALPPAPRILAFCQIRTVMEGRHPRPCTLTYDKTSGSTNGLRSIGETVPNKHPMMNTDCGA